MQVSETNSLKLTKTYFWQSRIILDDS